MTKMSFYIGHRYSAQSDYYKAYGQLTKKDARKKEDCVYGSMILTAYETKEEYEAAIESLKENGKRVY